jgi:hypothetical protein
MLFSLAALLQLHCSAGSFPHEHLAWAAQAQDPVWDGLQQVEAGVGAISGALDLEYVDNSFEKSLRTGRGQASMLSL